MLRISETACELVNTLNGPVSKHYKRIIGPVIITEQVILVHFFLFTLLLLGCSFSFLLLFVFEAESPIGQVDFKLVL